MKKLAIALFLIFVTGLAARPAPAAAQMGACPSGYTPSGTPWVSMPVNTPAGTWPDNTTICVLNSAAQYIGEDDRQPCGQYLFHTAPAFFIDPTIPFYLVPDPAHPVASPLRIRFLYYSWSTLPLSAENPVFFVSYVNEFGATEYMNTFTASEEGWTIVSGTDGWYWITANLVDITIPIQSNGGYLRIRNFTYGEGPLVITGGLRYASFQMGRADMEFPAHCPVANLVYPATPTPNWTPQPTPTGTVVPTMTPPTWPTSPPGTIVPPPTRTQITFEQMPAEPTATPWPIPTMANLVFPTPAAITPAPPLLEITVETNIIQNQSTVAAVWVGEIDAIAESWSTPIARSWSLFDSWSPDYSQSPTITGTETISSPVESTLYLVSQIVYPVQLIKSIQLYAPNIWPLVLAVFLSAMLMIMVSFTKFGVAIITTIIEIIRRIWQALPLT